MDSTRQASIRITNMKKMKILVVDDDPDFAEGVGLTLELEGHAVTFARNGEEAVRMFGAQGFDLTLMDVRMPGMNGVESLRKILDINPDAKVILITAYRVEELLKQAIDDGASGVLQKPVTSDVLLTTLREARPPEVVLVADDDPDFVEGVETTLTNAGYISVTARSGEEAVRKVLERDIDVLLLDIRMPGMSGLEVYGELKKLGRNPPTIVVTGYSVEESEVIQELLRSSARICLVKPIASEVLLQAIDDAL